MLPCPIGGESFSKVFSALRFTVKNALHPPLDKLKKGISVLSYQNGHNKKGHCKCSVLFLGALGGTRTRDLLVRSQSLYPAELQAHSICAVFQSALL